MIHLTNGSEISVTLSGNCAEGEERQEAEAYIAKLKAEGLKMGTDSVLKMTVRHRMFVYDGESLDEQT